jgi:hypothetical protein
VLDRELLDMIDALREIPREYWELLTFIRQLPQRDMERLKDLIQPKIPLHPDFTSDETIFKSSAVKEEEESGQEVQVASDSQPMRVEVSLDELRRFL